MESSPPADLVQTEADASVQGTNDATISPPAKSLGKNQIAGQASKGTTAMLIRIAISDGYGWRMLRKTLWGWRVHPIRIITKNSIPLRSGAELAIGLSGSGNENPTVKQIANNSRNHCREIVRHTLQITQSPYRQKLCETKIK